MLGGITKGADTDDLSEALRRIENGLDTGTYGPGQWAAFLLAATRQPRVERVAISDHVSRVSDKLHLRRGRRTLAFRLGILVEAIATGIGVLLLAIGVGRGSNVFALASAFILMATLQPLIKTSVGQALGIRYSYAYLWGVEPRFKMRYGTYLAAPRWRRVLFHLSGTLGSPFALWLVGSLATRKMTVTASICTALFWVLVGIQVIPFAAGLAGLRRLGPVGPVTVASGGGAGVELREAFLN